MANDLTRDIEEVAPTKMDTTASDLCTRAGAFALLLSMALISLIPYWLQEPAEISLVRYLSLRFNLITAIKQLDNDFYWQKHKVSHEAAESTSIEQLLEVLVESPTSQTNNNKVQSKPAATPKNKNQQADMIPPSPPSGLGLSMEIYWIHQIARFLVNLNDSDLLTNSRKAAGLFDYSIYRWALKRDSLIERNKLLSTPPTVTLHGTDGAKQPESFVPA